jgi:DNA-nicking Smr family endonuclease
LTLNNNLLTLTTTAGSEFALAPNACNGLANVPRIILGKNFKIGAFPGEAGYEVATMKPCLSSGFFRPFQHLKILLERESIPIKPSPLSGTGSSVQGSLGPRQESALFKAAMTGVKEISRNNCPEMTPQPPDQTSGGNDAESEPSKQLKNLIKTGTGFIVSHTPEYIEGTGYCVNPGVAKRLHRGEFSIQAHIDLHGLSVVDARRALDGFLYESILTGKRTVIIIHGRGLSSPAEPILKTKVHQWLTSSPWSRRVIAFSSARLCDGGTGATYVLLRRRPLKKADWKKKKIR